MSTFLYIAKLSFLKGLAYRADAAMTIAGRILSIFVQVAIWTVLYRGASDVRGGSRYHRRGAQVS